MPGILPTLKVADLHEVISARLFGDTGLSAIAFRTLTGSSGAPAAHATSHKNGGTDEILLHEFGEPTASVEFNGQQALTFRIENRTSDPGSPSAGQIWLRTDL